MKLKIIRGKSKVFKETLRGEGEKGLEQYRIREKGVEKRRLS